MQIDDMRETRISRERLFAQLRSEGIVNLGEVKRLYFESGGSFSIVMADERRPGLSLIPDWDEDFCNSRVHSGDILLCRRCGTVEKRSFGQEAACINCGAKE
ncbi:MAG: YetF domain-containing protein [Arcticibacter sp.]